MIWFPRAVFLLVAFVEGAATVLTPWPLRLLPAVVCVAGIAMFGFTLEVTPWDLLQCLTSKFLRRSPSPSNSRSIALASSPPSNPSPNVSRSLPSVTIDQPVVGFRAWKLQGMILVPVVMGGAWSATTEAICGAGHEHRSPDGACTCGLYATLEAGYAWWPSSGQVSGAVLASGKIIRHQSEGFRAEKMRILALARPPLSEVTIAPCPSVAAADISHYQIYGSYFTSATTTTPPSPVHLPHRWATEDRTLHLPRGSHVFKAKVKCEWCGCGPEKEFTTVSHAGELPGLEALAQSLGVPVVPSERLRAYASEFGIMAAEVKALA